MRLAQGIVVDEKETFGKLKFSALRREVYAQDENGNSTGELKYRTYDLKCEAQGMMIQVSLPPETEEKKYDYNMEVRLVEPHIDTVSSATYGGRAEAGWYIRAKDIVPASGSSSAAQPAEKKTSGQESTKNQTEQNAKKG